VNCEEEMREKNEMGEGGCMCVVGEKKKERHEGIWVVGEKKREIKRKKEMESGVYVYGEKKGGVEKKEEKKFEREKTKLVLFVCSLCLVQNVEL
jgi:fibrillarin-like rRNA methylase